MSWLSKRLAEISNLQAYVKPGSSLGTLKLDANENLAVDKSFLDKITSQALVSVDFREYPIEQLEEIYERVGTFLGLDKKYIGVGNGSDQIIEALMSTIARDKRATIFVPTFSYFMNRCNLHNVKVDAIPLNKHDNSLNRSDFLNAANASDMVYICSPNNPTGNQFEAELIMEIIESLKDKLVLLDEAYVEFARYSLASHVRKHNNLIVLRTLSKAFGLAGARVGYMISNEELAETFRSIIQSPYPLNSFSIKVASLMLSNGKYILDTVKSIKIERDRVYKELVEIKGLNVFKSDANFIFFESFDRYNKINQQLAKHNVQAKMFGDMESYQGCIRVTIGTPEMNNMFLESVRAAFSQE
ncbi:MAG TPA: histidinol-phosphate transaminase [Nitrososphaeraceae archaeon]